MFSPLDYLVLVVYLLGTATMGILLGRGQKDTKNYFLGGGNQPWWAVCVSIVATETSTLTFIGAPAIAYAGNITFLQLVMGYLLGRFLVSFILIPGYFRGEFQTAYEVLNKQFGPRVQDFSAFIFQITRTLADGVRIFATALVLSQVIHMSDTKTIIIIGVVTVLYTYVGGMRAVIWTDVVQFLIYVAGAVLAFFLILNRIPGGWNEIVSLASVDHKFQIFNPVFDLTQPFTLISGLVGGAFLTFATHGTDQLMVQRYFACGDRKKSQLALILSGVLIVLQFALFLVIGVMLFAFYHHFPLSHPLTHNDSIFPTFIVEQMPRGISGLVVAAIFAAAMSTLSGSLSSLASSSLNDYYKRRFFPDKTEKHYLKVSRILTLGWGVVLIFVSFLARKWGGVLETGLSITSFTMGSVLGIFLLGVLRLGLNQNGGLIAMMFGLLSMLVVRPLLHVSWPWFVFVGATTTVAAGFVLSFWFQKPNKEEVLK